MRVREGLYLAAANRYRRRIITLRTELEGLIPTYGDLIAIAHDMPSWGTGGRDRRLGISTPTPLHCPSWSISRMLSRM